MRQQQPQLFAYSGLKVCARVPDFARTDNPSHSQNFFAYSYTRLLLEHDQRQETGV
jgi:hypothetical protein